MKNIIWTTKYCPFCDKAKQMLEDRNMSYEARMVDDDDPCAWKLNDLLAYAPEARTFPQIWLGEKYIGGSDDLEYYFSVQELAVNGL